MALCASRDEYDGRGGFYIAVDGWGTKGHDASCPYRMGIRKYHIHLDMKKEN